MAEGNFSYKFPQYLSKPLQVLWFETDELIIFIFSLTLALTFGKLMWIVFFVFQYFYTKTKRTKPRGFLRHSLYVFGLLKMKNYPDYFEREFRE